MVTKNEIYEVEITGYGSSGEGIAKIDGYTLFVPAAAVGDTVRAKVLKAGKSYGYGKILEVLKASSERAEPLCPVYEKCGGCTLLHLSYEAQLEFKKNKVADALKKIGGFYNINVHQTASSPKQYRCRNKVFLPVGLENKYIATGFYAHKSHRLVPTDDCLLCPEAAKSITDAIKNYMRENRVAPYDEITHSGDVRHIYIRVAHGTKEMMVSLISSRKSLPKEKALTSSLLALELPIKSVILSVNSLKTNVILGEKYRVLYGRDYIIDTLLGISFKIHHNSFYQINSDVTPLLYEKAITLLGELRHKTIFDLYCGIGTISLCAAKYAEKVIGIEFVPESIQAAKENAAENGFTNTEFYVGDVAEVLQRLCREGQRPNYIILDPPRKGCEKDALTAVCDLTPEKIAYISCDPATLARDMKFLSENGYVSAEAFPFDMFPNTPHVETITLLQRRDM